MENAQLWILIGMTALSLLGTAFSIWGKIQNPDIKANNRLNVIESMCPLRHKGIDEAITNISKNFDMLKENHIRHMEGDIAGINEKMAVLSGQVSMMIELFKSNLDKK